MSMLVSAPQTVAEAVAVGMPKFGNAQCNQQYGRTRPNYTDQAPVVRMSEVVVG
jgi:hypothetical protein